MSCLREKSEQRCSGAEVRRAALTTMTAGGVQPKTLTGAWAEHDTVASRFDDAAAIRR